MSRGWHTSAIIGNLDNRRVALWQAAVQDSGRPPSIEVSYDSLLRDTSSSAGQPLPTCDLLRLESPGEDPRVEQRLILRGADRRGRTDICPEEVRRAIEDRGRIVHPHLWAVGYLDLLTELETAAGDDACWWNHPRDIRVLFDKPACGHRLTAAGIPTPRFLGLAGTYDQLAALLDAGDCTRAFVKLPGGSSASGVVALARSLPRISAVTSTELQTSGGESRLYNSLHLRRYTLETDVARLIDALAAEGPLHVEEWVPKAGFDGATFDLRVVVIAGTPQHIVMRTSRGPLTNLHLGNRRGDLQALREAIPDDSWESAMDTCRKVGRAFADCRSLGIDLAFLPGWGRHVVVEVNAFGDLLPGVLVKGLDTYAAQVRAECS